MSQAQPRVDQLIDKVRQDPPMREKMAVINNGTSLRTTIMSVAWEDAGIDPDDPGQLDHYYFRQEGVIVIDLGGQENGNGE